MGRAGCPRAGSALYPQTGRQVRLPQPIKDRPAPPVLSRWSELGDEALCTSASCIAEILQGLEVRDSAKYWRRCRELIQDRYPVLAFDAQVAGVFGRLAPW